LDNWTESIDNDDVKKVIKENAMVTGGALVSLLLGERPNDYDIYFKTLESCATVASYYANQWNLIKDTKVKIIEKNGRIQCFIQSSGIAAEEEESGIDDNTEPYATENEESPAEPNPKIEKPKYRPRYFTTNAISLSDDIQIVIRFFGSIEQIHENYDFEHCKCSYDYKTNKVNLPFKSLECIINKELYYSGSKYPLCSIIRTRKFISRGWTINAGQYVKMALQLNELDLKNLNVFKEQLVGVDSAYFNEAIEAIIKKQEKEPDFKPDNTYLFEVINRIF
jgi:hypothetical protein